MRLSHRTQAGAFDAWCVFVEDRQVSLQRLETALGHWNRATLTAAWTAWQEHAQHAQQQREVLSRAVQHFLNKTVAAAFGQWREAAKRKSENASKARMCFQVVASVPVYPLMYAMHSIVVLIVSISQQAAIWDKTALPVLLCIPASIPQHDVSAQLSPTPIIPCHGNSKASTITTITVRMIMTTTETHHYQNDHNHGHTHNHNRDYVSDANMRNHGSNNSNKLLLVVLQRLLHSHMSAAFQGWRSAVQEGHAKRDRMQRAASHFLNQRLAICFLTWRAALEKSLLGAAKLDHAVGHWLHATQAKLFTAWREKAHFKATSRPILAGEIVVWAIMSMHEQSLVKGCRPLQDPQQKYSCIGDALEPQSDHKSSMSCICYVAYGLTMQLLRFNIQKHARNLPN